MDNAQLYLSLVRPSMIPVVGESADDLFRQQIEVTGWKWEFHNLKEQKEAAKKREIYAQRAEFLETSSSTRKKQASIERLKEQQKRFEAIDKYNDSVKNLDRNDPANLAKWIKAYEDKDEAFKTITKDTEKAIRDLDVDQEAAERARVARERRQETAQQRYTREETERQEFELELENQKFSFSFTKRIDIATTQMLNSMKAGDVFPLAIFTMHQYSANNPMSLVIKIEGLRLMNYGFAVDANDTMTDLKEEWSCDFKGFSYVYQNRRSFAKPQLGSVSDAKQIAAKAATQGTVRAFVMMPRKL